MFSLSLLFFFFTQPFVHQYPATADPIAVMLVYQTSRKLSRIDIFSLFHAFHLVLVWTCVCKKQVFCLQYINVLFCFCFNLASMQSMMNGMGYNALLVDYLGSSTVLTISLTFFLSALELSIAQAFMTFPKSLIDAAPMFCTSFWISSRISSSDI